MCFIFQGPSLDLTVYQVLISFIFHFLHRLCWKAKNLVLWDHNRRLADVSLMCWPFILTSRLYVEKSCSMATAASLYTDLRWLSKNTQFAPGVKIDSKCPPANVDEHSSLWQSWAPPLGASCLLQGMSVGSGAFWSTACSPGQSKEFRLPQGKPVSPTSFRKMSVEDWELGCTDSGSCKRRPVEKRGWYPIGWYCRVVSRLV